MKQHSAMGASVEIGDVALRRESQASLTGLGQSTGESPEPRSKYLRGKALSVFYSLADQGFAVGGGFLANVALARTQTKEEYGLFALSYSVFTFLTGLHNAAILEPFTVFGSGRYRERYPEYLRLMLRSNLAISLLLSAILLAAYFLISSLFPQLLTGTLLGLAIAVGALLSGIFLRRVFYVQRQPALAAASSFVFFLTVAGGLWFRVRLHRLDGLEVFLILALGWVVAWCVFGSKLEISQPDQRFEKSVSGYWREHWNFAKWLLATGFVFQFTNQGYYWLVAGFLSAKEVGELRAMYLLIAPIDQVFIAISYLVVPALAAHHVANRIPSFVSLWKRFTGATTILTSLFVVLVWLTGKWAVHVLYAGKYDGLAPYLFVLAFLPLVMWIGSTTAQAWSSIENTRLVFWAYVSSGVATFLVGIPLVMHYGLWGAVYGMIFSATAYTIVLTVPFAVRFFPAVLKS